MIGKTILHYEILEQIGKGGMGIVYKARDTKLERIVAIKLLRAESLKDEEARERFKREAVAASRMSHPNITTIYQIEEIENKLFIAMEYVQGETLGDRLNSGPVEIADGLEIALKAALGIDEAHQHGIIHRDIKPDNILLSNKGHVKVVDFGLAKVKEWEKTNVTPEGFSMGTVDYMSPEQAQSNKVDARSDIFSFGTLLYELFTNEMPFKGEHDLAVLYSIVNVEPVPPRKVNREIPVRLEKVILRSLEKKIDDRYQSITEIIQELKKIRKSYTSESKTPVNNRKLRVSVPAALLVLICMLAYWLVPKYMAQTHINKALKYLETEDRALAEDELKTAVTLDPNTSQAWYYLASISQNRGDYKTAIEQSKKSILADKNNRDAYYALGFALAESKLNVQARAAYHKAIECDSSFVLAYSMLSHLYIKAGELDSASRLLKCSLRVTPDSPDNVNIYRNSGNACFVGRQYKLAAENYKKAMEIAPEYPYLKKLYNLADSCYLAQQKSSDTAKKP